MNFIELSKYGPIISDRRVGEEIKSSIIDLLSKQDAVTVDLKGVKSMATFNAKQIFGGLYLMLTPQGFFKRIKIVNATDDVKYIIKVGIQSAIDDNKENLPPNALN